MFRFSEGLISRWIAEALVIALGVFLGITAESLWQEQLDRRDERQHLIALREDFSESLRLLDEIEGNHNRQAEYIQELLRGNAAMADAGELRDWTRIALYNLYRYEPQLSALRDLESSGEMRLIDDSRIRRSIAKLQQQLRLFERREADLIDSQKQYIDAYLLENFDLLSILDIAESSNVDTQSLTRVDSSLFDSPALRSALAFKLSQRNQLSGDLVKIRSQMEHLLALIQERIGPRQAD